MIDFSYLTYAHTAFTIDDYQSSARRTQCLKTIEKCGAHLDLTLRCHDGLLAVFSDAYKNIYLSQPNRPAGMAYFDFVISEVHGLRIVELLKEKIAGRHVIGTFCVYGTSSTFILL
jgi:hypothetical protein